MRFASSPEASCFTLPFCFPAQGAVIHLSFILRFSPFRCNAEFGRGASDREIHLCKAAVKCTGLSNPVVHAAADALSFRFVNDAAVLDNLFCQMAQRTKQHEVSSRPSVFIVFDCDLVKGLLWAIAAACLFAMSLGKLVQRPWMEDTVIVAWGADHWYYKNARGRDMMMGLLKRVLDQKSKSLSLSLSLLLVY